MAERRLLRRVEALEQEQRDHYVDGREEHGDAVGEAICSLISEGRAQGLLLPDGRPAPPDAEPLARSRVAG